MMTDQQQDLRQPPHPIPGWLVVAQIPDPDKKEQAPEETPHTLTELMFGRSRRVEDGYEAGVVLEVGPMLGEIEEFVHFKVGSTVYYSSDVGIKISEFLFLQVTAILAWEDAP